MTFLSRRQSDPPRADARFQRQIFLLVPVLERRLPVLAPTRELISPAKGRSDKRVRFDDPRQQKPCLRRSPIFPAPVPPSPSASPPGETADSNESANSPGGFHIPN